MKKTAKSPQLIFSTRSYPTFGRSKQPFNEVSPPKTVTDSPYYWWFMFLRLNADYEATCKAQGQGACAELFKDFGDIYKINFKDWWKEKSHLFAEPKKGYRMAVANTLEEIAPFGSDEVINLVVPLTWSRRSLLKSFTSHILNKIEKGKRGVSVEKSDAPYRLSGKWSVIALSSAYNVYLEKVKADTEPKKLALADIAIRAKIPYAIEKNAKEGVKNKFTVDIRATLTVLANKHYKRAQKFIESASSNSFPNKLKIY
jgi:hypothetical protein